MSSNTFDLKELPELLPIDKKELAKKLVDTFVGSVTCVFLGDGLYGQTQSIKKIRAELIQCIGTTGLNPIDFRVNCQDVAGEEPIWKTIEEASNDAIESSSVNDRFWA